MCQGSGTSPPGPRRVGTETSERSKLASCPQQHHPQVQGQGSRGTLFSPPASLKMTVPSTQQPLPLPSVREGSIASLGLFALFLQIPVCISFTLSWFSLPAQVQGPSLFPSPCAGIPADFYKLRGLHVPVPACLLTFPALLYPSFPVSICSFS